MQRVTVTLDDDLMAELDAIIAERGYQNRSEAIRDLARAGIKEAAPDSGRGRDCVAALVYVYDHEARQLSKRLVRAFTISTSCRSPSGKSSPGSGPSIASKILRDVDGNAGIRLLARSCSLSKRYETAQAVRSTFSTDWWYSRHQS